MKIVESTNYPFGENIRFDIHTDSPAEFPLHLRVPLWCDNAVIKVNGVKSEVPVKNNIAVIKQKWNDGDCVELELPMKIRYSHWAQSSLGIERGPLVYALKIEEEWRHVSQNEYDDSYSEVYPKSPWNYALLKKDIDNYNFQINFKENIAEYPWNLGNAPIEMTVSGVRLPYWQLDGASAGKIPANPQSLPVTTTPEKVVLVPYGCTTLRISQFPVR